MYEWMGYNGKVLGIWWLYVSVYMIKYNCGRLFIDA